MSDPRLQPPHLETLRASAISDEVIAERGYVSVTATDPRLDPFADYQRGPGILIPIRPPDGSNSLYSLRHNVARVKTDRKTGKTHSAKYEIPTGQKHRLDVPPRCRPWLTDTRTTLFVTEGIKKADALASAGRIVVGLGGVWCFRKECIPDWKLIALKGRTVVIVFDSDAETNENVAQARDELARFLTERGATVKIMRLPPGDEKKNGIDDLLGSGADLVEMATQYTTLWVPPEQDGKCRREECVSAKRRLVKIAAIHNSNGLKPTTKMVGIAAILEYEWKVSAGRDDLGDGFRGISRAAIAKKVNLKNKDTVTQHLKVAEKLGVIELNTRRYWKPETVNEDTGEIEEAGWRNLLAMRIDDTTAWEKLAVVKAPDARIWKPKQPKPCPDHQNADLVIRRAFHCAACDALLDQDVIQKPRKPVFEDAPHIEDDPRTTPPVTRRPRNSVFEETSAETGHDGASQEDILALPPYLEDANLQIDEPLEWPPDDDVLLVFGPPEPEPDALPPLPSAPCWPCGTTNWGRWPDGRLSPRCLTCRPLAIAGGSE